VKLNNKITGEAADE